MNYTGKLYGKVGRKRIALSITAEQINKMQAVVDAARDVTRWKHSYDITQEEANKLWSALAELDKQ